MPTQQQPGKQASKLNQSSQQSTANRKETLNPSQSQSKRESFDPSESEEWDDENVGNSIDSGQVGRTSTKKESWK